MKNYYVPFSPGKQKYKYLYLLGLYKVAEYDRQARRYNKVKYQSLEKLAAEINQEAG